MKTGAELFAVDRILSPTISRVSLLTESGIETAEIWKNAQLFCERTSAGVSNHRIALSTEAFVAILGRSKA